MIGILLMSHGNMAQGMLESAQIFFGQDIRGIHAICLQVEDNPETFGERIEEGIRKVDDGDGVVAFVDLKGGTPSNRSFMILRDVEMRTKLRIITGMNFPMLLELMGQRETIGSISELDVQALMDVGKDGISCLNDLIS